MTDENAQRTQTGFFADQRSRYEALATGIRSLLPDGGSVLDVGCGESMLLGAFLPDHRVTYLDPLLAQRDGQVGDYGPIIGRRLDQTTVADGSYDVAVCVDVLEHIPAGDREAFVRELVRVSRKGVVLAAPFAGIGDAQATDDRVNLAYRTKTGQEYGWLSEHEEFGLPQLDDVRQVFESAGLHVESFGNGHTPWLKDLLSLHVLMLDQSAHVAPLREIGDRFAADVMQFDFLEPTYRQVVVAGREEPAKLPTGAGGPEVEAEAMMAWERFRLWVDVRLATHADSLVAEAESVRARLRETSGFATELTERVRTAEAALTDQRALEEKVRCHHRNANVAIERLKGMERSLSWRCTSPIRLASRSVSAIRSRLLGVGPWILHRAIPERLRWPLKCAFFGLFRPLLKDTREYREFLDARRWRDRAPEPAPAVVADKDDARADILVLGVIDWHLRIQRPQHLARQWAAQGHRVFYFTPGFHHASEPGYRIESIDEDLPVYQVRLFTRERASVYDGPPSGSAHEHLVAGFRAALGDVRIGESVCVVDHPGWVDLALQVPRSRMVYDCMDNHHGFSEAGEALPHAEARLLESACGVVVTSDHIAADIEPRHHAVRMIRNGCDPDHFAGIPDVVATGGGGRPVIGYFGAVAEWFDADLLRALVEHMTDCDFVIVGADTAEVEARLRGLENLSFVGEVSYEELPSHIAGMHVLLIPFVINELTLATNPVKAYEALAAGRPVVATEMPELMDTDLGPYVRTAADVGGLVNHLRAALEDAVDADRVAAMRRFAHAQNWGSRAHDVLRFIDELPKRRVGVVIVSWNGVDLTRRCLESTLEDPFAGEVDVVIVDNASEDGSVAWLQGLDDPRVRVICNQENLGFAAACNQGLAAAAERDPELLVILNNDIVVTPGWTTTMLRHLCRDPEIGLIGPVTNNIGNQAKIDTAYESIDDMPAEQRALTGAAAGRRFEIPVLAFFSVAIPADVYREVGGLDENFGTGFFEDDDYCQRVRALGRRLVCAEDVFVHHELSASFDRIDQDERKQLFERNRAYYESKWGQWQRHEYRPKPKGGSAAAS